jgi:low affinity Fe/Cu permease
MDRDRGSTRYFNKMMFLFSRMEQYNVAVTICQILMIIYVQDITLNRAFIRDFEG